MPPTPENLSQPSDSTASSGTFDNFLNELHNQAQLTPQDVQTLRAKEQSTAQTNSDARNLPPVVVHDDKPKLPADTSASTQISKSKESWGDFALDTVLGAGAMIAAEAVTGYFFKNPEIGASAVNAIENSSKLAPVVSSTFGRVAIRMGSYGAAWGTTTVTRHYASEIITGKSESWKDSSTHAAWGIGTYATAKRLGGVLERIVK